METIFYFELKFNGLVWPFFLQLHIPAHLAQLSLALDRASVDFEGAG